MPLYSTNDKKPIFFQVRREGMHYIRYINVTMNISAFEKNLMVHSDLGTTKRQTKLKSDFFESPPSEIFSNVDETMITSSM